MEQEDFSKKVKQAIKKNFDVSPETYDGFEERYGLFTFLASKLAEYAGIREKMEVLDVGCGSGVSSKVLAEMVGKSGRVVGVDLSPNMLIQANKKILTFGLNQLNFVCGDAETLRSLLSCRMDAVLFNASIFLMPNPQQAIGQAAELLKTGGVIGASYPIGVLLPDGTEFLPLVNKKFPECPANTRQIVSEEKIHATMETLFKKFDLYQESRQVSVDEARAFYSIQAQSASLFPKLSYPDRLERVKIMFSAFETTSYLHRWGFVVARKE